MKKCKKCGAEKPIEEFMKYFHKQNNKYYYNTKCKSCQQEYTRAHYHSNKEKYSERFKAYYKKHSKHMNEVMKNWRKNNKDGYHYVYYIPEHHYIGVSNFVKHRMYRHNNDHKRIIDGFEIVYKTKCRKEAELVESKLHSMGYQG